MKRRILGIALSAGVVGVALLGCNSVLDNTPGTLVESSGVTPEEDAGTVSTPSETSGDGSDASTDPPPNPPSDDPACPKGQRTCFGTCVPDTDPAYGCGSPTCTPCNTTRGTAVCRARACAISACDPGYADCNGKASDGCEVDLSKPTSCGACNAVCGAANPLCAPVGATFECTNGCTPGAPLACGAECVDPNTSVNHCGGCNVKCPVVANGTAACTTGTCGFTCKTAFHACGAKCVARTDPATCGPDCLPCPVPAGGTATCVNDTCGGKCPAKKNLCAGACVAEDDVTACGAECVACPTPANGTPTCKGGACGMTCSAGFADCDKLPANGCESELATDRANCGACGKACPGADVCKDGKCAPPAPPL